MICLIYIVLLTIHVYSFNPQCLTLCVSYERCYHESLKASEFVIMVHIDLKLCTSLLTISLMRMCSVKCGMSDEFTRFHKYSIEYFSVCRLIVWFYSP